MFSISFRKQPKENNGKRRKLDSFIYHQNVYTTQFTCHYNKADQPIKKQKTFSVFLSSYCFHLVKSYEEQVPYQWTQTLSYLVNLNPDLYQLNNNAFIQLNVNEVWVILQFCHQSPTVMLGTRMAITIFFLTHDKQ